MMNLILHHSLYEILMILTTKITEMELINDFSKLILKRIKIKRFFFALQYLYRKIQRRTQRIPRFSILLSRRSQRLQIESTKCGWRLHLRLQNGTYSHGPS